MRLGIKILDPSSTINNLKYVGQATFSPGDTGQIWMQLVDLDSPTGPNTYSRYMPAAGATVSVNFYSNNNANAFTKYAIQPLPIDPSIWSISLLIADTQIMAGPNLGVVLTQGAMVSQCVARNVLSVNPQSPFQC